MRQDDKQMKSNYELKCSKWNLVIGVDRLSNYDASWAQN